MVEVRVPLTTTLFIQLQALTGLGAKFQTICNWLDELTDDLPDDSNELEHVMNNRRELLDIQAALCDARDQVVCQFEDLEDCESAGPIAVFLKPETCVTLCSWASVGRTFDGLLQSMHYALDIQSATTLYPIERLCMDMHRPLADLHGIVRTELWKLCKDAFAMVDDDVFLSLTDRQQWKANRMIERAVFHKRDIETTVRELLSKLAQHTF